MSCGWRSSDRNYWQDNYLFTQFISKAAPPNTNHNIRVVVDIQYTLSSCRERLGCNPKFELLKFETSGPQPREVYTDVTNYQSIRIKTGSSAASQSLIENIGIPANIEGLYLAVRDNRSCIQVAKMQVYRYQCNSKQEGLVIFPETAAPMSSNMTVTAQCTPHSYPVTHMDVVCTDNGQWSGSGQCRCNPGYYRQTGIEGDYCSGKYYIITTFFLKWSCNDAHLNKQEVSLACLSSEVAVMKALCLVLQACLYRQKCFLPTQNHLLLLLLLFLCRVYLHIKHYDTKVV